MFSHTSSRGGIANAFEIALKIIIHFEFLVCPQEEELRKAILVVLANKQDMAGAMTVSEMHAALGLDALRDRTFQIFKTSAIKGDGLDEAMEW